MIQILGATGSYTHLERSTSFLVDESIAIDAGNLIAPLKEGCCELEHLLLTHTHYDHITDIPFVLESYFSCRKKPLKLYALKENIEILKSHIFNDAIWPDFSTIFLEQVKQYALEFIPIAYDEPFFINGIEFTPLYAQHTVPTSGFKIKKKDNAVILSGDTYLNPSLVQKLNGDKSISTLLIDVSFPSDKEILAQVSQHLTPKLLFEMLKPLTRTDLKIYTYHQKSFYSDVIEEELRVLNDRNHTIEMLFSGETLNFLGDKR